VFDIQDKSYVYVLTPNNTLRMRNFTPLTRISGAYLVRDGITPGERILFEGAQNVREGMTILPQSISPAASQTLSPDASQTLSPAAAQKSITPDALQTSKK
jgi:membrane fusion protein (multidrug efflux system)